MTPRLPVGQYSRYIGAAFTSLRHKANLHSETDTASLSSLVVHSFMLLIVGVKSRSGLWRSPSGVTEGHIQWQQWYSGSGAGTYKHTRAPQLILECVALQPHAVWCFALQIIPNEMNGFVLELSTTHPGVKMIAGEALWGKWSQPSNRKFEPVVTCPVRGGTRPFRSA